MVVIKIDDRDSRGVVIDGECARRRLLCSFDDANVLFFVRVVEFDVMCITSTDDQHDGNSDDKSYSYCQSIQSSSL